MSCSQLFNALFGIVFAALKKTRFYLLIEEVRQFLLVLKAIIVCFVLHGGTWWYI